MATIVLIPDAHWPPPVASPITWAWKTVHFVPPHYCHLCRKWQTWATVKPILIFVFIRKNGDSQPRSKHGIIGTINNFLKIIGVEVKVCCRLIFNSPTSLQICFWGWTFLWFSTYFCLIKECWIIYWTNNRNSTYQVLSYDVHICEEERARISKVGSVRRVKCTSWANQCIFILYFG